MNSTTDKQLKNIKAKKREITKKLKKEQEILDYLNKTDSSWSKFIKKVFNKKTTIKDVNLSKDKYLRLRKSESDNNFFNEIQYKLDHLPKSNGSRYFGKFDVKIGVVCEPKFYETFVDTAHLIVINPDYNISILEEIDILLISNFENELCGDWNQFEVGEKRILAILNLIKHFKQLNKPVIFYDQCQEIYSDKLPIIHSCDEIYTTVSSKVNFYKENGLNNVKVDSYAVNPIKYNPIGSYNYTDSKSVLYYGKWNNSKETLEEILDGVVNSNKKLKIIDPTNYEVESQNKFYPLEYLKYITPSTSNDHYDVYDVYKLYDFAISYNEIEKVFILQALGKVVISNYHPYLNNKFPNVYTVDSQFETLSILNTLSENDIRNIQLQGIRNIMSNETSFDKMGRILNDLGIVSTYGERTVLVIGNEKSKKQFENQTYKNADFIDHGELTPELLENYDFVTYFNPNYFYEEYYLEDLINGFKYTDSDFVSKNDETYGINSFTFHNEVKDFDKTLFFVNSFTFDEINQKSIDSHKDIKGFYIDTFEVNSNSEQVFENKNFNNKDKMLSVIVPIYNNGKFLQYKCFMSLKRSSIFKNMEIIFVDDGSTDFETQIIVDRIYRTNDNVKLYKFEDDGSGSASRPRNKGLELSNCKYITYLDPDNEAINDGYAKLLAEIESDDEVDLVVGNISRYDSDLQKKEINYYKTAIKAAGTNLVDNPRDLLIETNLKVQSIQALVVNKNLIEKNDIKMVESAAGQDTLFFQELMIAANKMKIVDLNIHVYYAAVDNSVTNTVSSKFYEKYFKVEKERIKFLQKNDLFDIYMEKKFQFYFVNWYLRKLIFIQDGHEEASLKILKKIYDMYAPYLKEEKVILKQFKKFINKGDYKGFVNYCRNYFNY